MQIAQSPDYFNSCTSVWQVSIPLNTLGYQSALSGNAYCGMHCYATGSTREYLGTQLISSLVIGQKYFVSFYLSLSGGLGHTIGCNKFGCKLSTTQFIYNNLLPDNNATFHTDSIITDTINWVFIKESFIADSAYSYIAFGNFYDNTHTDIIQVAGTNGDNYFYIENVCLSTDSMLCIGTCGINEKENSIDLKISPNPCNEIIMVSCEEKIIELKLYSIIGEEVIVDSNIILPFEKRSINVSSLKSGIYLLRLSLYQKNYSKKIIIN